MTSKLVSISAFRRKSVLCTVLLCIIGFNLLSAGIVNAQSVEDVQQVGQASSELQHVIGICNQIPTLATLSHFQKDIDDNLARLDAVPETRPVAEDYRQAVTFIREADILHEQETRMPDSPAKEQQAKKESELRKKASQFLKAAVEALNQLLPLLQAIVNRQRGQTPQQGGNRRLQGQNQSQPGSPSPPNRPSAPPLNPPPRPTEPDGCPLPRIAVRTPTKLPQEVSNIQSSTAYRNTFLDAYPEFVPFQANLRVHHAIPQAVLLKYPGRFTLGEMHSINNLRGICYPYRGAIHDTITNLWRVYYLNHQTVSTSRQDILDEANQIDQMYGAYFDPYL